MTTRENVLRMLRRQGFDAVPIDFVLCRSLHEKMTERIGTPDYQEYFRFPIRNLGTSLLKAACNDWSSYYPGQKFNPGTEFDFWGVAHEYTPESMHMSRMYHPMQRFTSLEELEKYPYPRADHSLLPALSAEVKSIHANGNVARMLMEMTIWETAWYMRSMEEMMMGMIVDDELTGYLLSKITDIAIERVQLCARADVDIINLGDDIGMQHTIMMSVDLYRKHLKTHLKQVIDAAKKIKPDILISYHSCGYVEPFIRDLIEVGVDILNPVQTECMDFAEIHSKYGQELSFSGTIGTQTTFPFGTSADVRNAVEKNLRIAGPQGGLLVMPTHMLEPEVPMENIFAYIDACHNFKW